MRKHVIELCYDVDVHLGRSLEAGECYKHVRIYHGG